MITPSPLWFATRGAGAVTLILLTTVVVLGIATTTRQHGERWPRFLSARLHGNLAVATLVFLVFHVATAVIDPFARLRWTDAVVPFGAAYRPVWLGLGVVAAELMAALALTSGLRSLTGYRTWRAVHWAAYACWPLALLHGLGTGSDAREAWFQVLDSACVGTVFAAVVVWRLGYGWPRAAGLRTATAVASGLGIVALALWTMNGPLAPGWARAAGTPPDLLHSTVASGVR